MSAGTRGFHEDSGFRSNVPSEGRPLPQISRAAFGVGLICLVRRHLKKRSQHAVKRNSLAKEILVNACELTQPLPGTPWLPLPAGIQAKEEYCFCIRLSQMSTYLRPLQRIVLRIEQLTVLHTGMSKDRHIVRWIILRTVQSIIHRIEL